MHPWLLLGILILIALCIFGLLHLILAMLVGFVRCAEEAGEWLANDSFSLAKLILSIPIICMMIIALILKIVGSILGVLIFYQAAKDARDWWHKK